MWNKLRELGVATVEVDFSGGNDEGGCDEFRFFGADGETIEDVCDTDDEYLGGRVWDHGKRVYKETTITPEQEEKRKLAAFLTEPVDERYGSFAGDFSVSGTVTFDVATETTTASGSESSYRPMSW